MYTRNQRTPSVCESSPFSSFSSLSLTTPIPSHILPPCSRFICYNKQIPRKIAFSGFLQCHSNILFTHSESHIRLECPRNTKVCTLCSDSMMYRRILMLTSRLLVVLHFIRPHTLTSTRSSRRLPSREGSFRVRRDFHTTSLKDENSSPLHLQFFAVKRSPMFDCYTTVRYGH